MSLNPKNYFINTPNNPNIQSQNNIINSNTISNNTSNLNTNYTPNNMNINTNTNNNILNNNTNLNNKNTNQQNPYSKSTREERLLIKSNFEKLINEKLKKNGLVIKSNNYGDIVNSLNNGLDIYLKNLLEKLIIISRARNVNLNLYSKQSEKNPTFKIKTFNSEKPLINPLQNLEYQPYKEFSIIFSKNMKSTLNNLEQFEELNACKLKYEKISSFRNKIEEINLAKEKEKEKINSNKNISAPIIPAKTRTRKRDTNLIKNYKNIFAKTQKKDEMDRQKKDIKHTLEAVLDTKSIKMKVKKFKKI
jgi:hypothetical protein